MPSFRPGQNNPDYKVAQNALSPAKEGRQERLRTVHSVLGTNGGMSYQGSGHVIVQGETFDNPAFWALQLSASTSRGC